ncbi:hypothetical protein BCR32DRAFT_270218 [Anaeromyces robustus]|uniref:SH3 domain-containing protein n=1 Tax=Anaeromyces robustus TaxID=1754192 RepID=A0A1Y1WY84_9FUNG|nr:hypothetical protein BCR32DRAFT_270218 [Anaeromyces robustus]|eukprot:ORX78166.1 hypothetical protein BCR32DRAFT_270218 [Anaeromyces robustus]
MTSNTVRKRFIDNLKNLIKNDNYKGQKVISEDFYEWRIENWKKMKKEDYEFSPIFNLCNEEWKIGAYKGYSKFKFNFLDLIIMNIGVMGKIINYNCAIAIHSINDYTTYISMQMDDNSFTLKEKLCRFTKSDYKDKFKTILKENKVIISVYIQIYEIKDNKESLTSSIKEHFVDKEEFIEDMECEVDHIKIANGLKFIDKNYFEWKIEDWKKMEEDNDFDEEEYSPEFEIGKHHWRLKLYPNGCKDCKDFISLKLENMDVETYKTTHIFVRFILFIANYYDYGVHYEKKKTSYFSGIICDCGENQFIAKKDLYNNFEKFSKPFIQDNKVIFGTYVEVYNYDKSFLFYDELEESINNFCGELNNYLDYDEYEFTIGNWKKIKNENSTYISSPEFNIGGYNWTLLIYPNEESSNEKKFSIRLHNSETLSSKIYNFIAVDYILYIRDYNSYSYSLMSSPETKFFNYYFTESEEYFENSDLYSKNKLTNKSLIESNKLIVGCLLRIQSINKDILGKGLKSIILPNISYNKGIIDEDCYEWEIKDWENIKDKEEEIKSPEFNLCNYKWNLGIYPNGYNECVKDNLSFSLYNLTVLEDNFPKDQNVFSAHIFYIRNKHNFSYFHFFGKFIYGLKECIGDTEMMNDNIIGRGYFEFNINCWECFTLKKDPLSFGFTIGNYWWQCIIYQNSKSGKDKNYISLYLKCKELEDENSLRKNDKVYVKYVLYIRNPSNLLYITTKASSSVSCFDKENIEQGYEYFIDKSELTNEDKPLLENDSIIYGCYLCIYKNKDLEKIKEKEKEKEKISEKEKEAQKYSINNGGNSSSSSNNNCNTTTNTLPYLLNENGDLAKALYEFKGSNEYELSFSKNDYIRVIDWNFKEGWAYGYKSGFLQKKGTFPKALIQKCEESTNELSNLPTNLPPNTQFSSYPQPYPYPYPYSYPYSNTNPYNLQFQPILQDNNQPSAPPLNENPSDPEDQPPSYEEIIQNDDLLQH